MKTHVKMTKQPYISPYAVNQKNKATFSSSTLKTEERKCLHLFDLRPRDRVMVIISFSIGPEGSASGDVENVKKM